MQDGNNIMEQKRFYTNERNVQIVIALLKAHGIHRVIVSPGTTNMTFVVSIENDPWFHIWSSVDERSASYLACGMAAETGEPVVISCTGATASRNYMPGLTEAYYRKLPVLAITSTRGNYKIGHLIDQQIDRRNIPNDIAIESVTIPMVKDYEENPKDFDFMSFERYSDFIIRFLERLSPDIVIERFAGEVPPRFQAVNNWNLIRNEQVVSTIEQKMTERKTFQGRLFKQ